MERERNRVAHELAQLARRTKHSAVWRFIAQDCNHFFSSSSDPLPEEDRSPVLRPDQYMDGVTKLTSQHAVVIFSTKSSCATRDAVATLFRDLGVSSLAVVELDEDPKGKEMEAALARMMPTRRNPAGPAVLVAGRPVGSTDEVMSLHLGGKLVPLLRDARAILPL